MQNMEMIKYAFYRLSDTEVEKAMEDLAERMTDKQAPAERAIAMVTHWFLSVDSCRREIKREKEE